MFEQGPVVCSLAPGRVRIKAGVAVTQETSRGRVVGGRYRLLCDIGSGGFGRVWKARDETLCIDVAVKELWLLPAMSEAEQSERLTRAAREARNAARLRDHPNIVGVHDVVVEDGLPWIVMRFIEGSSLQQLLDKQGLLSVEQAAVVAAKMLEALGAAHQAGIVHRDVKPANVMMASDGEVLLADFGIAVHHADTALTSTGAVIGSVEYMAPERARGTDGLAASDLFSLGVTLYQAVEGVSPFRRGTPTGCLAAVLFEEAAPSERAGRLAPLITGLLEKDPDRRPTVLEALALLRMPESSASTPQATATSRAEATAPGATPTGPRTTQLRPGNDADAATDRGAPTRTRRRAVLLPLLVGLLIVACAGVAVVLKWPFWAEAGPKGACDQALRAIDTFQRNHPAISDATLGEPAEKSAAGKLAIKVRAAAAKAPKSDVSITLRDYAITAESKVGDRLRASSYQSVVSACKKVGSEVPSS
ncbi:serine/threonine-protein kinase [Streptomyces sp. NPDC052000]|uniref:serine/threonine-protein kinase n=1 Tax=Streptomyces sp. NPDC052000 TaxID=3155676 RepID=UPI00344C206D